MRFHFCLQVILSLHAVSQPLGPVVVADGSDMLAEKIAEDILEQSGKTEETVRMDLRR